MRLSWAFLPVVGLAVGCDAGVGAYSCEVPIEGVGPVTADFQLSHEACTRIQANTEKVLQEVRALKLNPELLQGVSIHYLNRDSWGAWGEEVQGQYYPGLDFAHGATRLNARGNFELHEMLHHLEYWGGASVLTMFHPGWEHKGWRAAEKRSSDYSWAVDKAVPGEVLPR